MDLIRWGILLDVVKTTEYRIYNPAANIQPHHILLSYPSRRVFFESSSIGIGPNEQRI